MFFLRNATRRRSFFKRGEGSSATQPIDTPVLKVEIETQIVDELDRSIKLKDQERWPLDDSFNNVSNFLDSMPGKLQVTEAERNLRATSPSSHRR